MTHHQAIELLPCPFCGAPAQEKRNRTVMVSCTQCTAATFQELTGPSTAIAAWNRRAPAPASEPAADRDAATYTCKGKGGDYSLIGTAYGAGTSRGTYVTLYRDISTDIYYFRTPEDFMERMAMVPAPAAQEVPAVPPLVASKIPEPGYSDSLADRIFNLPCKWRGDERLSEAVQIGHTMACEQAYELVYAGTPPSPSVDQVASEKPELTDHEIFAWAEGYQFSYKGNPHKMNFSRPRFIEAVRTILSHSPAHRAPSVDQAKRLVGGEVAASPSKRDIFAICDAYESGMGHGLQRDGHKDGSIWGSPDCGKAYEIGYEEGADRASAGSATSTDDGEA